MASIADNDPRLKVIFDQARKSEAFRLRLCDALHTFRLVSDQMAPDANHDTLRTILFSEIERIEATLARFPETV